MSLEYMAFLGVTLTVALSFISVGSHYWLVHGDVVSFGLHVYCEPDMCAWFLEDGIIQRALPGRFKCEYVIIFLNIVQIDVLVKRVMV